MFSLLSSMPSSTLSATSNLSLPTTPSSSSSTTFNMPSFKSSHSFLQDISCQNSSEQIVLWSCAQIDCHCYIDESKVILNSLRYNTTDDNKANEIQATSFQPNKDRVGTSVYSSKPKILFCNLSLRPGETKSCW